MKSALLILAHDLNEFTELWGVFEHRKKPCSHWPELKRYFDEEYVAYFETVSEDDADDNFRIMSTIFSSYKARCDSDEPRVKLGGAQKQFAKKAKKSKRKA